MIDAFDQIFVLLKHWALDWPFWPESLKPMLSVLFSIVPLMLVFALLFGFALTRIDAQRRLRLIEFFQAIAETMMVIVRWVLWLAPMGVFALVLPMAARTGAAMVGGIASYLIVDCGMCVLTIVAMYPLAVIIARVPLRRFARAITYCARHSVQITHGLPGTCSMRLASTWW